MPRSQQSEITDAIALGDGFNANNFSDNFKFHLITEAYHRCEGNDLLPAFPNKLNILSAPTNSIRLFVSMMLENVFQRGGIQEVFSPLFELFKRGGL